MVLDLLGQPNGCPPKSSATPLSATLPSVIRSDFASIFVGVFALSNDNPVAALAQVSSDFVVVVNLVVIGGVLTLSGLVAILISSEKAHL